VKLCYQRQRFEDHLKTEHHMKDNGVIEKIETRRISRDCQARFWCGFCIKLIDLKKKGLDAWKERFDHIDNHFMGCDGFNKQSISDWIPVGSDKPEGKIQIPLSLHASADSASSSGISSDSTMRGDGDGSGQAGSCMHFSNSLQI
jgi:hypothetical protein